ncbi:protein mono-ADP-ribosyltransferase PARP11 [Mugil cephalus]|uniref:protein mono-ADP-ribosyltransferase PARP11 n=1 Tax=Mugil cephalus TaxID=48193 RepID=UPI001FB79FBA|nr:protein mono-ADP-ribosyltransferase PARP11 [Mugil cephalus]
MNFHIMLDNDGVEPMDTSDTSWGWYYLADCGRWHRFEDYPNVSIDSEVIDRYYLRDKRGVFNKSTSGCRLKIDFSAMLLTDITTGRQRLIQRNLSIERSCSCFSAAPVFWETIDPTCPYQLIPLSESTPEYQTVANYVKTDGLLDKPIASIIRIQNLDLWEIYCRKKAQLSRIKGVTDIPERRLFHGTDVKNVDSICKYNFDLRLAGKHGNVYGKGIYFARHASYADKYSRTDPLLISGGGLQGINFGTTRVVFLARVIIGKPIIGQRHFKKPDDKSLENSHDSCVDDDQDPKIFVIFDPNQIYPEYLIQYS